MLGGERFGHVRAFVPGSGNPIGFEDLIVIEAYEFCQAVAEQRPFVPGLEHALVWASVQDALRRSVDSGGWEAVVALGSDEALPVAAEGKA